MSRIVLDLPPEAAHLVDVTDERLPDELRMLAAVKLFELHKVTSSQAAALAGIPRVIFLQRLGDYGVATFDLSEEELQRDLETLEHHAKQSDGNGN